SPLQRERRAGRRTCGDVSEADVRRTALFHPLREEPAEILLCCVAEYPLEVLPICPTAAVPGDELFQRAPKRLVADFLPEEMKYQCRFLIADGVVAVIVFLCKLPQRIVPL